MYKGFGDFTTTGGAKEGLFNSDGTPQYDKVKALTRSYVQAFQGEGKSMRFDTNTGRFTTNYYLDTSIQAPTVIYLNEEYWYSNSYKVTVDANHSSDNYTIRKHKNRLEIQFDENAQSTKVSLTITAPTKKTQDYANFGATQAWWKYTDLAELNDEDQDPMDSWVNFYVENNLENVGPGLLMKITGTDGKVIFQSQEDFRRAVAIAPAEDLMDAKLVLYKNSFFFYEDIIMSLPLDNLNGHNVDIKLMDLMQ